MLGYATIGTNDLPKSKAFYDTVLAPLGGRTAMSSDRMHIYASPNGGMMAICTPYDGSAAAPGNGNMLALTAATTELVDQVHALALENGATCDGPPGQRMPTFYGAYFRDLDGNKICVFKMG